jgi:glycosyltransferase involved in cell wall biosynthesis
MKNMRILFIDANLDGTVGGSHILLLDMIRFLDKNKFKPHVLFFENNTIIPEFKKVCTVFIFDKTNRLNIKNYLPFNVLKFKYLNEFLLLVQKIYNLGLYYIPDCIKTFIFLRRKHIDIVYLNNAPYLPDWLLICKLLKIKCVAHLRGNWIAKSVDKYFIKYYDRVISMSQSVTEFIHNQGLPTNNFIVVYDGIDTRIARKTVLANKIPSCEKHDNYDRFSYQIGLIGNIQPWKGQHVLIKAIKILKPIIHDIQASIVGDVSYRDEDREYYANLMELVSDYELKENIIFTGFKKEVYELINTFDIMVHTSVDPEPFGRVILEGMIMGKPVIATAHGGPLEILEDGINGFLVAPDQPEALANKILFLYKNPDIAKKVGENAIKRVEEHFSMEKNIKSYEILLEKLFNKDKKKEDHCKKVGRL